MRPFNLVLVAFLLMSLSSMAQKPKSGTYTYSVAWEEWGGRTLGATCTVIIKGDSIRVVNDGKGTVSGKKGDILDEGIIMKHKRTGKWIIAHKPIDVYAKEPGGCGEGPTFIDFVKRRWWSC